MRPTWLSAGALVVAASLALECLDSNLQAAGLPLAVLMISYILLVAGYATLRRTPFDQCVISAHLMGAMPGVISARYMLQGRFVLISLVSDVAIMLIHGVLLRLHLQTLQRRALADMLRPPTMMVGAELLPQNGPPGADAPAGLTAPLMPIRLDPAWQQGMTPQERWDSLLEARRRILAADFPGPPERFGSQAEVEKLVPPTDVSVPERQLDRRKPSG